LLHCDNTVDSFGQVCQISFVAAAEFGGQETIVADLFQGEPDLLEVHIAFEQVCPLIALALEVFQMDFDDALTESSDPVLGIPVENDIADVEICLEPRTFELIDVSCELQRAQ